MIYKYICSKCGQQYEIFQSMHDKHEYICPQCEEFCSRVFDVPSVKPNKGFFSLQLGRYVNSHTEFEEGLDRVRFLHDLQDNLGDNRTPKDEWIEEKIKKDKKNESLLKRQLEEMDKLYDKTLEGK